MKTAKRGPRLRGRKGIALVISMIFVFTFAAFGIAFCTSSGTNVKAANNQRLANSALASTDSGLNILRFWLSRVAIPGSVLPMNRLDSVASSLQNDLTSCGVTNITTSYAGSTLTIPDVNLGSSGQSFSALITLPDVDTLQVDVTGTSGVITRTTRVTYTIAPRETSAFDYGIATRGPLQMTGSVELGGLNISVESDVFIDSPEGETALSMSGHVGIAGNVHISDPNAVVDMGNNCSVGGETGEGALDHIFPGAAAPEFPIPQPGYFEQYVTTTLETADNEGVTLENIRIPSGLNPTFSGNTIIRGVVFIEEYNIVTFEGNCHITGIIVGNGNIDDPLVGNQINFLGTVDSCDVSTLPDEPQFDGIRDDTGTFIMAPGFSTGFEGTFSTLNGSISANEVSFTGNASGTINGSVINYSTEPMVLDGNGNITFNRSEEGEVPAGFIREVVLNYLTTSYSEMTL